VAYVCKGLWPQRPATTEALQVTSHHSSIDITIVSTMGEGPFWFLTLAIYIVHCDLLFGTSGSTSCLTVCCLLRVVLAFIQSSCPYNLWESFHTICLHLDYHGVLGAGRNRRRSRGSEQEISLNNVIASVRNQKGLLPIVGTMIVSILLDTRNNLYPDHSDHRASCMIKMVKDLLDHRDYRQAGVITVINPVSLWPYELFFGAVSGAGTRRAALA